MKEGPSLLFLSTIFYQRLSLTRPTFIFYRSSFTSQRSSLNSPTNNTPLSFPAPDNAQLRSVRLAPLYHLGVDVARKYKESREVVHAIEAHHGDVEAKTVIACLVQAADAISAARPGARRENVQNYIKRLEKLEEISKSFEGVENSFAIQAGREVRIMVKPEVITDDKMVLLARDIVKKIEEELEYPGQIKVNIIRENRATDYAK